MALSNRINALMLPFDSSHDHNSVREADIRLLQGAAPGFLDGTHFDTLRFPPPAWAAEAFDRASKDGSLAYTGYRGHEGVLDAVAQNVSAFLGSPIDGDKHLILTPGTQAGLFSALAAQVDRDDRVALMDPDYLFTERMLRFLDAEPARVPLVLSQDRYAPDLDVMERLFRDDGVRHLVFSHPNNPTGAVFPPSTVEAIASLARRYDVSVIVDELYARLVYPGVTFTHIASVAEPPERVTTLLGPSKTESLSGYRLGVVISSAEIIAAIENVIAITSLRAPAYAQHLLPHWLGPDQAWLNKRLADFASLRAMSVDAVNNMNRVHLYPQDGTAYLWPDVSDLGRSGFDVAEALLKGANILVSPGYQFGPSSHGHFRLCYARDEHVWERTLSKIIDVLSKL